MKSTATTDTPGLLPNRACRNCVQIKVKCTPLSDSVDPVCQRCHRLGKTCTTPAPVVRKQRAKSTRVAHLEQRLDQLTALLGPTQLASESGEQTLSHTPESVSINSNERRNIDGPSPSVQPADTNRHANGPIYQDRSVASAPVSSNDEASSWPSESQSIRRTGSPSLFVARIPGRRDGSQLLTETFCPVHLGSELEDHLFKEFRDNMAKLFPFVAVDRNVSSETFKTMKPFAYWACILAAAHRDRKLHLTLHDEMMKAVGYRMLVAGGKTIDLLQGLLITIAWTHNISHYNPQFMNLLHLALALLADLGIMKSIRAQDKIRIASDTNAFMHGTETNSVNLDGDAKRALLGCYCFSWKASLTFNRIDPMRFSSHIESCCESLRIGAEYGSDLLAVEIVQLYRIVDKYLQVEPISAMSSHVYRTMFSDEVQRYKQNLPAELVGNHVLEMEIHGSLLCLLEPQYTAEHQDKFTHLNALHNCVAAGNCLVEVLIGIPNRDYPNCTFFEKMTLLQLLIVFSRLSFFKSNNWDIQYARSNVNLDVVLERLGTKFTKIHQVETAAYPQYQHWRALVHAQKAHHIKEWYKAKVVAEEEAFASSVDNVISNGLNEGLFGTFDDTMWQDLLGNWTDF